MTHRDRGGERPARRQQGRWGRYIAPLLLLLALGVGQRATAQPAPAAITVTPATIPLSASEIVNPMRGYYRWYGAEPIPQPRPSYDRYVRYGWRLLEPSRGKYDFSAIEADMRAASAADAKFAFRIMAINEFTSPVEIPHYLQSEAGGAYCTFQGKSLWVPNWDSPQFIARAQALMRALGARFDGDPRLAYYDIGIYGHWGEWHTLELCTPPASSATKRALVDVQVDAFPRSRLLMNSGGHEVDAFVYALAKSPRIGVRVDSLCDSSFDHQLSDSPEKLAAVKDRWKTAPLVTEFYSKPTNLTLCNQQVRQWHVASVANHAIGSWSGYSATQQDQLLQVGKSSGYRFVLNKLTFPDTVTTGTPFTISAQWSNVGVTPAYEPYVVLFELRQEGQPWVVWSGISQLNLEQFLPTTTPQMVNDTFKLPTWLKAGNYTLKLIVHDRWSYRPPLALAISGASSTGRYSLGTITVQAGQTSEQHTFFPIFRAR